jgi:hypothetical protein
VRCSDPRPRRAWLEPVLALALAVVAAAFPAAHAAPATYTGGAPVNSQSDDERVGELRSALAKVVIEQTGDSGVLARADLAKAIERADRYMVQYSYRPNPVGDTPLVLVAQFDAAAVDQMLQRFGLGPLGDVPVAPEVATEATVWIGGLADADDYARVMGYLARNNFVKSAQPLEATADGILVRLSLGTDVPHFVGVVGAERVLAESPSRVDGADAALTLAR